MKMKVHERMSASERVYTRTRAEPKRTNEKNNDEECIMYICTHGARVTESYSIA